MYDELVKDLRIYANDETDKLRFDAADAIEELQAAEKKYLANISALETENQHLKREREWISVKDRLPTDGKYLVCIELLPMTTPPLWTYDVLRYSTNLEKEDKYDFAGENHGGFYDYNDGTYFERKNVLYWMPLPELPKEVET